MDSGLMYFDPNGTGGTFTDVLTVSMNVRFGSLNGPIVGGGTLSYTNNAASNSGLVSVWTRDGPYYGPVIQGVNYLLDGIDINQDLWAMGPKDGYLGSIAHQSDPGNNHTVHTIPEPSGLSLFALGALALVARVRQGRR
jgi:hypothetical protein